jgi:YVTN family beta-propeller protein
VIAGIRAVSRVLHGPGTTRADWAIAYVLFQNSGTVTPIRAATNTALPPIKLGRSRAAYAFAITPNVKTAYVLTTSRRRAHHTRSSGFGPQWIPPTKGNNDPGTVIIPIRTATNTALAPIKVGGYGDAIAITPDGKTAYVASIPDTVTPIRTATNTALPPIKGGVSPEALAITPDGKTAYVANLGSGTVTPIRAATNTALPPITVGRYPIAMAITTPASPTP